MPTPIVSENSGLFLLTKDVPMSSYKPFATELPTSWAGSGLPTGVSINTTTGVISGTPTVLGTNTVSLTATNGTGTSAPLVFVMKVVGSGLVDDGLVNVDIDLQTLLAVNTSMAADSPLTFGKNGDIIGMALGFKRDGVLRAMTITNITVAVRDTYSTPAVTVFNAAPAAPLDVLAPRYRVAFDLSAAEIMTKLLATHERDGAKGGTDWEMRAKCEVHVEWTPANAIGAVTELKRTTVTFPIHLAKKVVTP